MTTPGSNDLMNQRTLQFDTKHGGGIEMNGWMIFADGARRALDPLGKMLEPSADTQERERVILQYQELALRKVQADIARKQQALNRTHTKTPAQLHHEFDIEHSKLGPGILDGANYIYPNGAYRSINMQGVLAEPVQVKWEPLKTEKRIVRYYEIAIQQASDQFNEQRNKWLSQAKGAISHGMRLIAEPPEEHRKAVSKLKVMKTHVTHLQTKLDEARKLLVEQIPQEIQVERKTAGILRDRNARFITEIEKVEI